MKHNKYARLSGYEAYRSRSSSFMASHIADLSQNAEFLGGTKPCVGCLLKNTIPWSLNLDCISLKFHENTIKHPSICFKDVVNNECVVYTSNEQHASGPSDATWRAVGVDGHEPSCSSLPTSTQ